MNFFSNILANVVADVALWLLLGLTFASVLFRRRRRLLRFFGLESNPQIVACVSNLWDPATAKRKIGYSVSKHELFGVQSIRTLLESATVRAPEIARGLVDSMWIGRRVQLRTEVSPSPDEFLDSNACLVVIGSARRNSVRKRLIDQDVPRALLAHETPGSGMNTNDVVDILIHRVDTEVQSLRSPLNLAIVEKVLLHGPSRTIFFCAGLRGDSSRGAVEYLMRNWRALDREFGTNSFVVCLGFPRSEPYPDEYVFPVVLSHTAT